MTVEIQSFQMIMYSQICIHFQKCKLYEEIRGLNEDNGIAVKRSNENEVMEMHVGKSYQTLKFGDGRQKEQVKYREERQNLQKTVIFG